MHHRKSHRSLSAIVAGTFLALAATSAQAAAPAGDAKAGAKLFLQCRACHTVDVGGKNGVGPNLAGIVGAKAAAVPGYKFSPALTKANITWTPETLDTWLKRPSAMVPGTKMAFAGMANPKARADMIAYLSTLKGK
ncbi:c-type cytochrome [Parapedomonas caeni]